MVQLTEKPTHITNQSKTRIAANKQERIIKAYNFYLVFLTMLSFFFFLKKINWNIFDISFTNTPNSSSSSFYDVLPRSQQEIK